MLLRDRMGQGNNFGSQLSLPSAQLRQHLRQIGEIASGKKLFLTKNLDIGLECSTMRDGDIVCILN